MTWWHWMNGNITKEGITADLEAMKRIGLGGAQIFNVSQGEPLGPVKFMSAEWRALTKHAVMEADRLGLKLAIHNCAGWSESGGPWVTPDQSMQKVVWTETYVAGGSRFSDRLPKPETVRGSYHEIAVLAFPTLVGELGGKDRGSQRMDQIDAKIGRVPNPRLTFSKTGWPADATIVRSSVVDLTDKLSADGRLIWDAPAGNWTVIRFGHTSTGAQNAPAPDSGRGLECDKLNRTAVEAHFNGMMAKVIADAGPLAGKSLKYVLADSWEAGTQNWTPAFRTEFQKRTGYDLTPWLPIFTGRVIGSLDQSERVLWDFRRVIADLTAEKHYSVLSELCARYGMELTAEAPGIGMPTIADEIQCKGRTAMPMGEFWLDGHNDSKEAATSAHVYGKRRASAEAFTAVTRDAKWMKTPFDHKAIGDLNFCRGINLFVFHRYAMQPWLDKAPGMTMGPWGTNFERTNTWWEQAGPWMSYISRCQALLQDGLFVADACYYYGEGAPNTIFPERSSLSPPLPAGYDFDVCDTQVLLTRMSVKNGRVVLPDGMSYRVLVLPDSDRMSLPVLRKVRDLAAAGATIVGPRPTRSPSMAGFPASDAELVNLANQLWGAVDGANETERRIGRSGRIIWGKSMAAIFTELNLPEDVTCPPETSLIWIHRRAGNADVYFVSNQDSLSDTAKVVFRAGNRRPELWEPDTGRILSAGQFSVKDGRVTVRLHFDGSGSAFVVFRRGAGGADPVVKLTHNGRETDSEDPDKPVARISIESAFYGVNPERAEQSVNIARELSAAIRHGRLRVQIDNSLAGDPALNIVKHGYIVYTVNGSRRTATVDENGLLDIPAAADRGPDVQPEPPGPELTMDGNSRYRVTVTQPGQYVVETGSGRRITANVSTVPAPLTVSGAWDLRFPPKWGAPEQVHMDPLASWSASSMEGVQHFSGTAAYSKDITIPAEFLAPGHAVWLDLGVVKEVAQVFLNGKSLGILWKPPFHVDLTSAARTGKNHLEVRVTNLWPNRLIGDAALPESLRFTYATFQPFKANDPLLESGLLGPVVLQSALTIVLK